MRTSLGHRTFVAVRLYVSGEFEAASHCGGRPELRENGRKIVEAFDGLTSVYPDREETNE